MRLRILLLLLGCYGLALAESGPSVESLPPLDPAPVTNPLLPQESRTVAVSPDAQLITYLQARTNALQGEIRKILARTEGDLPIADARTIRGLEAERRARDAAWRTLEKSLREAGQQQGRPKGDVLDAPDRGSEDPVQARLRAENELAILGVYQSLIADGKATLADRIEAIALAESINGAPLEIHMKPRLHYLRFSIHLDEATRATDVDAKMDHAEKARNFLDKLSQDHPGSVLTTTAQTHYDTARAQYGLGGPVGAGT